MRARAKVNVDSHTSLIENVKARLRVSVIAILENVSNGLSRMKVDNFMIFLGQC